MRDRHLLTEHKPWKGRIPHPTWGAHSAEQPSQELCSLWFQPRPLLQPLLAFLLPSSVKWTSSGCALWACTALAIPQPPSLPPANFASQSFMLYICNTSSTLNHSSAAPSHRKRNISTSSLQKTTNTREALPLQSRPSSPPGWPCCSGGQQAHCFHMYFAPHMCCAFQITPTMKTCPSFKPPLFHTQHALALSPFPQPSLTR